MCDFDREEARLHALTHYERALWESGVRFIAGMDEAGRGPLAGPVVAACVVMPRLPLIKGVQDSKAVTSEKRREMLFESIMEHAVAAGVGIVFNTEIDEINILAATRKVFLLSLSNLGINPEFVLCDYVHGLLIPHEHTMLKKGDALSYSIGAASIVAKVTRDRMMREAGKLYPQYGFERHKGYCTPEHEAAIMEHGLCPLHRRTFCRKFAYGG